MNPWISGRMVLNSPSTAMLCGRARGTGTGAGSLHCRFGLGCGLNAWFGCSFFEAAKAGQKLCLDCRGAGVAMAGLGDMTPAYPGVTELTRQLDQEKIAMLSQRVDDLRNQNQDLKV